MAATRSAGAIRVRQHLAITCPLNEATGDIAPYRQVRAHATGLLIMTILAVDR